MRIDIPAKGTPTVPHLRIPKYGFEDDTPSSVMAWRSNIWCPQRSSKSDIVFELNNAPPETKRRMLDAQSRPNASLSSSAAYCSGVPIITVTRAISSIALDGLNDLSNSID